MAFLVAYSWHGSLQSVCAVETCPDVLKSGSDTAHGGPSNKQVLAKPHSSGALGYDGDQARRSGRSCLEKTIQVHISINGADVFCVLVRPETHSTLAFRGRGWTSSIAVRIAFTSKRLGAIRSIVLAIGDGAFNGCELSIHSAVLAGR